MGYQRGENERKLERKVKAEKETQDRENIKVEGGRNSRSLCYCGACSRISDPSGR